MASKKAGKTSHRTETKRRGRSQTNPNSLANLQPFKRKADNGGELDPRINVGGRPKGLSEAYRRYLDAPANPKFVAALEGWGETPRTNADLIAARAMLDAVSGNAQTMREIRAATEAILFQMTGKDGGPLQVEDINATRARRWKELAPAVATALAHGDTDASGEGSGLSEMKNE